MEEFDHDARGGEPAGWSRREFLKRSAIAGAVAWSAPAIATLPGATALAAGTPPPCPCPEEDAFGLKVVAAGLVNVDETFGQAPPGGGKDCAVDATVLLRPGEHVKAGVLCGRTGECQASADAATLDIAFARATIQATVLHSEVTGSCPPTGGFSIATLRINGDAVDVAVGPNTGVDVAVDGTVIGKVVINEQNTSCVGGNKALEVNALHVTLNADGQSLDVIVSHSEVVACNCPC